MLETIDIQKIVAIAEEAGRVIMEVYARDFAVEYKSDDSPLTEADTLSNAIICKALQAAYPQLPILSEEGKAIAYESRKAWEYFWCIDPIDGTKEFIRKNDEFTVNIALIHCDTPVLGVVYAPALGDMYYAKKGEGAYKKSSRGLQKLPHTHNTAPEEALKIVASKSHLSEETQAFIDELAKGTKQIEQVSKGSSLKLCMVAEGDADIYPRLAPTMEWDTAAADAVVRESGKMSYQYTPESVQKPLVYNKEDLLNPWFVVR